MVTTMPTTPLTTPDNQLSKTTCMGGAGKVFPRVTMVILTAGIVAIMVPRAHRSVDREALL
jgi:hypothetical protein